MRGTSKYGTREWRLPSRLGRATQSWHRFALHPRRAAAAGALTLTPRYI
ncbi:hypothetical protein ACT3R7_06610 [Halomonas sp. AOP43-A1-21]